MSELTLLSPLPAATAERVESTLDRLLPHLDERAAVVGGLAIRYHVARAGQPYPARPLRNIDMVGQPHTSIGDDFMIGHYHAEGDNRYFALVDHRTQLKVDLYSRPSHMFMAEQIPYSKGRSIAVPTAEFQLAKTVYDTRKVLRGEQVAPKQFADADLLMSIGASRTAASRALKYFEGDADRQYILSALEEARDEASKYPWLLTPRPHRRPLSCDDCINSAAFPLTPLPVVYGVMAYGALRHRLMGRHSNRATPR
jgi:hypothetical protein